MDEDIDVIWMREKVRPFLPEKHLPRFDAIVNRLAQTEADDAVAAAIDRQTARLEALVEPRYVLLDRTDAPRRPSVRKVWDFLTKEQKP